MSNFFIIDHSLRKSGGHHFDYVSCVAQAANELGFLTTIGTNREFSKANSDDHASLDRLGNVRRFFRDHTYQQDSYLAGLQHLTRSSTSESLLDDLETSRIKRVWNARKNQKHRRRRENFVRNFSKDCDRFFRPLLQTGNDHAFFTTVSELELMGLAAYLSSQPKTLNTTWHLQFHFNLFEGRTPDYENQQYIAQAIKSCFLASLSRLSYHSVNFYATSDVLVDQYNRLGVGEFEVLPYPISSEFGQRFTAMKGKTFVGPKLKFIRHADEVPVLRALGGDGNVSNLQDKPELRLVGSTEPIDVDRPESPVELKIAEFAELGDSVGDSGFRKPLRITCPGELRREKNQIQYLQPLIDKIWGTHLGTGAAQIVVQRPAKKWHSRRQKLEIELPEAAQELPVSPVEYFSHPLDKPSYVELIKSSDCGLLFYDSRVYFSRRAGVLGELLSAGKPVIVPAGSWLAQQIQEPIFRYLDELVDSRRWIDSIESSDFDWDNKNVPMPGGVLSFDDGKHPFKFSISNSENDVLKQAKLVVLRFDWHWPTEPGIYCRVDVTQKDGLGNVVGKSSRVVGFRESAFKVPAAFQLEPTSESVEFSLTNAFHASMASIRKVDIQALCWHDEEESVNGLPLGQVGIVASDLEDLPNCIDEYIKHSAHYAQTAQDFAKPWYAQHAPRKTVEHLIAKCKSKRYAA